MSFENETRFVKRQGRTEAQQVIQAVEAIIRESYYKNNPPKVHPFRDALLILSAVALGFVILSSKPINHFEANRIHFNFPKPVALYALKDSNR